jgi:hypothetical protein
MPILATGRLRASVTIHPPILAEARYEAVGLNVAFAMTARL